VESLFKTPMLGYNLYITYIIDICLHFLKS
jgi:hypothetical protein